MIADALTCCMAIQNLRCSKSSFICTPTAEGNKKKERIKRGALKTNTSREKRSKYLPKVMGWKSQLQPASKCEW